MRCIQPQQAYNVINPARCLAQSTDENHPRNQRNSIGHFTHCRKNHFKKENICDADKAHAGKHSAPRLKDVFRRFTSTHGKCERSKKNKYAHNDISFADFKKQLENLKQKNEPTYNRQQPPGGKVKQAFIEWRNYHTVWQFHKCNNIACEIQPDLANLRAGQQQKRKKRAFAEKKFWVFRVDTNSAYHTPERLKY